VNVLLTSLSRKVPLLAAFRRALSESSGGGQVWGADSDPECVGRYFSDRFWEMPALAEPAAPERLAQFCAEERIGLLVPTRDGELAVMATLRERLAAAGTHVAVGSEEAVDVCLDKLRFHDHCRSVGIPTPATVADLVELDGGRFVVKERRGMGGRAMAVGVDREGALRFAERLEEPIFQPLLDGMEHSVDLYVNRDGRVVDAAPRTRIRVHEGESVVTETVEHPDLAAAAIALAESLPLRGHAVIQGFVRDRDAVLIECNPRVGGASTLGFAAGIDSPRWALAEASGETVPPRLGAYRRGLRLVRYPADRVIEQWS
jgi:carbamoyl-phosphate synthase large subunit